MGDEVPRKTALPKGFAGSYDDAMRGSLDLNQLLVSRPASTYFVRVEGDNMASQGAYAGDILIVDRSLSPKNEDVVIVVIDGEMLVRQLSDTAAGRALVSGDTNSSIDLNEDTNIEFWGVATASIRQFRKAQS